MSLARRNRKTVLILSGVIVLMGGLAWSAVPLYDLFCRLTGFGGTTNVAESGGEVILDQTITVRFAANLARGMEWEFRPPRGSMELRIGETALVYFEAYNPTDRPIAGTASYNVTPFDAGRYFSKIECFCFTEQLLQPGERVEMPVTFFVDPELVNDAEARDTNAITLSYTFHETELPDDLAALSGPTD